MPNVYGNMSSSLGDKWRKLTDIETRTTTRQRWVKFEDYEEATMERDAAEVQAGEQQNEIDRLTVRARNLEKVLNRSLDMCHMLVDGVKNPEKTDETFVDELKRLSREMMQYHNLANPENQHG